MNCELCQRYLRGAKAGDLCPKCQERVDKVLKHSFGLSEIALNVKRAAELLGLSEGHLRRVLEHPEKYGWADYGIADAYPAGKKWRIFLEPLEYKEALSKQRLAIGEGALNLMRWRAMFGIRPLLTGRDVLYLLTEHLKPLGRKTAKEREEQRRRFREDPDAAADRLGTVMASFVQDWAEDMAVLGSTRSSGRQPRSAGAGREHQYQPGSNSAAS